MRRTFRTVLVSVLVFSLSVDSATACRFFARGCRCYRPCVPVCYEPCYPVCYEPCYMTSAGMVCQQPCEPCYSSEVVESVSPTARPSEEPLTVPEPPDESMPTPATVNKPPKLELPPTAAPESMPGPNGAEAVPSVRPSDEWRATNELPELPAEPSDDLFGAPPEEPAMSNDNLPGEASETKSAPAATEPAPAVTPPAEESDNLFGPSPESQPSAPAETGDDLFGPSPSAPAEQPPSDQPSPSSPAAPADDLFGPSSDEPSAPAEESTDSSTRAPSEEAPAEDAAPAEESTPPAENQQDDADDLFGGFGAILREPGGLASDASRKWVDNTGRFSCHGRMIQFKDGQVRLLKDNGRTTTVPIYRLSQGDLEFVHRQASAQRADVFGRTADNSQLQSVN